ncbi:hypothetical protein [Natronospora cellulosivora (SeqCode)]
MKKIYIYIVLFILFTCFSSISSFAKSPYSLIYNGKVNNSNISMEIIVEGNNLIGSIHYEKYDQILDLEGLIEEYEYILLKEYNNNELVGIFKGKIKLDNIIEGTWMSPTGEKNIHL